MENNTSNELGKAIVNEVEKMMRLYLDKICNKYESIDRRVIRKAAKKTLGIEIGETRREFLEKEWDPENGHPFSKYKNYSNVRVNWICEKGHLWPARIADRTNGKGCPFCCNKKICKDGSNSLGACRKDLIPQWDPENDLTIFQVAPNSNKMAKWICDKGHKYTALIIDRMSRGDGCSYCSNHKICKDGSNSLGVLRPEFIKEWDPENDLTIFQVAPNSNKMAKWICDKGHKYPALISSRTSRGDGCPYCSNQKICKDGSNSLGVLRPEFIKEWDPDNDLSIFQVSVGSRKMVKWICDKGHKYPALISSRTKKTGCPICANKKISIDKSNSLGVLRPEFIKEWDLENTKSIFDVTIGSSYIAKWICDKGHKYEMVIYKRSGRGDGCSRCNESKGEKFINQYLTKNNIEFSIQYKISYNECPNLRCDFYLKKTNTCIEFDGIQHFEERSCFGGEEGFLIRIRNDNYKNLYCKENGMSIIRIHYLDINDTDHLSNLISQIDIENPKLILSKNYPLDWLYTMY